MPKENEKAPAFTAKDQNGRSISLSGLKGSKVALYFYPKDDTPTCIVQACNLRDGNASLKKAGYRVIGVSPDTEESHAKFATKFKLPFSLLADPNKKVIDAYGVWGPKKLYGREYEGMHRTTFLIDEKGIISKVIAVVRSKTHTDQILK